MLSLGIAELPVLSTRARGDPTSYQRYQIGDLNACDTFYRSVLPEYPNLSTFELSVRFGIIDRTLLGVVTDPIRLNARRFKSPPCQCPK